MNDAGVNFVSNQLLYSLLLGTIILGIEYIDNFVLNLTIFDHFQHATKLPRFSTEMNNEIIFINATFRFFSRCCEKKSCGNRNETPSDPVVIDR